MTALRTATFCSECIDWMLRHFGSLLDPQGILALAGALCRTERETAKFRVGGPAGEQVEGNSKQKPPPEWFYLYTWIEVLRCCAFYCLPCAEVLFLPVECNKSAVLRVW